MAPHREVEPLQELAHDRVLYTVCGVILQDLFFSGHCEWEQLGHPVLSPRLQGLREVLSNALLPRLMQDLLNTILERDEAVEATVRFTALQLLLVPGVTELAVGHFPEPFYAPVLSAIADSAAELRTLDLRGVWVRDMHKFYLCKAIRRLHTIRHLTLRYTCDDEILAIIGKNCPNMETLDIAGSKKITDVGIKSLYEKRIRDEFLGFNDLTKTLRIVDIGGPAAQHLPVSQICLLLRFLPNLRSLESYDRAGAAVEMLCLEEPSLKFTKLRFIRDIYTNKQRMSVMVTACPNIEAIYLDCAKGGAVQLIHQLKELKELRLHKTRWSDVEVALQNICSRLRKLYLSTIWGSIDIYTLSKYCPNLSKIELHSGSIISSEPDYLGEDRREKTLPELRECLLYQTRLTAILVKKVFRSSDQLIHVGFGECNQLTDEDLISCINASNLKCLREFWFGQACRLTIESLKYLMENCPSMTSIGNLAGWGMEPGETSFIRMQLALTNTDLTLYDFGSDQDEEGYILMLGLDMEEEEDIQADDE